MAIPIMIFAGFATLQSGVQIRNYCDLIEAREAFAPRLLWVAVNSDVNLASGIQSRRYAEVLASLGAGWRDGKRIGRWVITLKGDDDYILKSTFYGMQFEVADGESSTPWTTTVTAQWGPELIPVDGKLEGIARRLGVKVSGPLTELGSLSSVFDDVESSILERTELLPQVGIRMNADFAIYAASASLLALMLAMVSEWNRALTGVLDGYREVWLLLDAHTAPSRLLSMLSLVGLVGLPVVAGMRLVVMWAVRIRAVYKDPTIMLTMSRVNSLTDLMLLFGILGLLLTTLILGVWICLLAHRTRLTRPHTI